MQQPGNKEKPLFSEVESSESVNYMLRTVQQNYVQLTLLAEHKANIIVGSTFIVLALLISNVSSGQLPIGLTTLSLFLLIASVFAIFALLPSVDGPHACKEGMPECNPLFFPFFANMRP